MTLRRFYTHENMINLSAFIGTILYHAFFLITILKRHPKRALEIGCGRGLYSIFLSYLIPISAGIDSEKEMITLASALNRKYKGKAKFCLMDGRKVGFPNDSFDVVYSQGLLEHYDNEDLLSFINEWSRLAPLCIISVPARDHKIKIGDEKFRTIQEYLCIFRNTLKDYCYYGFNIEFSAVSLKNMFQSYKLLNPKKYASELLMIIRRS